jgi:DnaJ-class molecular chaperone
LAKKTIRLWDRIRCPHCKGEGKKRTFKEVKYSFQVIDSKCKECSGQGQVTVARISTSKEVKAG